MIYLQIFWVFLMTNLLGYGGGPATIPLIQKEVVDRYEWMTVQEFNEAFAMGNALPGPIATKMGGYIGFQEGGWLGAVLAVLATVTPSLILMITLMGILYKNGYVLKKIYVRLSAEKEYLFKFFIYDVPINCEKERII